MKKEYTKPEITFETIWEEDFIAASGPGTNRYADGTPTEGGNSISGDVYDGSGFDPNNNHGQGENGGGNRAKGMGNFAFTEDFEFYIDM